MSDTPNTYRERARIAGLKRAIRNGERPANDPALIDAQRRLREATTAAYIAKVLDAAPPLTDEQRTRLAELLSPVRMTGGAA